MKIICSFIIVLFLNSCVSQNNTSLRFINRLNENIDSIIVLSSNKYIHIGRVKKHSEFTQTINNIIIDNNSEGEYIFNVYINKRKFSSSWGFHYDREIREKNETFYILDNGISKVDQQIKKPKEFNVHFYNTSTKKIDSIFSYDKSVIQIIENTPRNIDIVYDYDKFSKNPILKINLSGSIYSKNLQYHNFENYQDPMEIVYFSNNELSNKTQENQHDLEFIIYLEVQIPIDFNKINVSSKAFVKSYDLLKNKEKKIIFDFNILKQNPIIKVFVDNKTYNIDLTNHDFNLKLNNQKMFYLNENGIESLN